MGFLYSQLFVTPKYPAASFTGKTVIVTGSNVGLGKEAARHMVRLGAEKTILAVRNLEAGERARQDILGTTKRPPSAVDVWQLDLSDFGSVKRFAQRASQLPRLDVLLENAAVAAAKFDTAEGHERSITVNVISTYLLALLLLPKLKADAKAHGTNPVITFVTSEVHGWAKLPERRAPDIFAALSDPKTKSFGERYEATKLLEVLINREMAPRIAGSGVVLNMLNPGLCHSELARDAGFLVSLAKLIFARSTEVGSRTLVLAASAGPESHGKYMNDGEVDEGALSRFVRSKEGKETGEKVWKQLLAVLEKIEPGIGENI